MGTDPDLFVHPERISSQLICPICTQVLENPVQTVNDHLYCEDELIEWMSRHDIPLCPVTHEELKPDDIRKPSRIIINMLAELERYCPNKENGCEWIGSNEQVNTHIKTCNKRSIIELINDINIKDNKITQLRQRLIHKDKHIHTLEIKNNDLMNELVIVNKKLKVYDAFFEDTKQKIGSSSSIISGSNGGSGGGSGNGRQYREYDCKSSSSSGSSGSSVSGSDNKESALQRLLQLRELGSFEDEGKS